MHKFKEEIIVVILAAGNGRRMLSSTPKPLQKIGGAPLVEHVLKTAQKITDQIIIITDQSFAIESLGLEAELHYQSQKLGTAHAVLTIYELLRDKMVVVLYADTPFISSTTINQLIAGSQKGVAVALFPSSAKSDYGTGLFVGGALTAIIEAQDRRGSPNCDQELLANSGLMVIAPEALDLLKKIEINAKSQEYQLTDLVKIAHQHGFSTFYLQIDAAEGAGVNSLHDLANAEFLFQQYSRERFTELGVKMIDAKSVYFSFDTEIEGGASLDPFVVIKRGVKIKRDAIVKSFCVLEESKVQEGSTVGPFVHLASGSEIGVGACIGNFSEIKRTIVGPGSKAKHLTYLGDTVVGTGVNIGAGVVTCNFDGVNKLKTTIGDNVFVGSNSCLIAPVTIDRSAMIAAGSVINQNVGEAEMAATRVKQINRRRRSIRISDKPA